MNFLIRVDSSLKIGTGHIMRCLTLADELLRKKHKVEFVCRPLLGHSIAIIEKRGFKIRCLPLADAKVSSRVPHSDWLETTIERDVEQTKAIIGKIDWLLVDHYALDKSWEEPMRSHAPKIFVIDDLADRAHYCDGLLDQNLFSNPRARYGDLISPSTPTFLGPQFALLRPEFKKFHKTRKPPVRAENLLIFLGGVDYPGETIKVLEAIEEICHSLKVTVVTGAANPALEKINALVKKFKRAELHLDSEKMAEIMSQNDLAIMSGGVATWERLCVGLPSLVIAIAENQIPISQHVADLGLQKFLGQSSQVSKELIRESLKGFLENFEKAAEMGQRGPQFVDGLGTERVCQFFENSP